MYPFASLDSIALEPHFRAARQAGQVEDIPFDEGMFLLALQAAAWRVPFLPTRVGLGSDLMRLNPMLRTVKSPVRRLGHELVAVPAFELDAVICHLNRADDRGNASFLGPDLYFDDLFSSGAAPTRRFIHLRSSGSVPTAALLEEAGTELRLRVARMMVDGVVESPGGALVHVLRARLRPRRGAATGVRRVGPLARGVGRLLRRPSGGGIVTGRASAGPRCAWSRWPSVFAATGRLWPIPSAPYR